MSAEIATKLKQARAKLGLSQSQASKAWDVPLPTLKTWECNTRTPRGFTLAALNEKLDAILAGPPPPAAKPAKTAPKRKAK